MDWNQVISVISELVKDESTRSQIYKRLLDGSDYLEREIIEEECLGYDDAFDTVWKEYFAEDKDDDPDEYESLDYDDE
jgi:hypothetical protein